jgi:DNA-binding transcriptional ArsR family regulator
MIADRGLREMRAGMVVLNDVGDVVVSDEAAMLALADKDRFALVERLRRLGTATVAELAAASDNTESDIRERLGILADVGLVTVSEHGGWQAVGAGLLLDVPDDPAGQLAARKLASVMLLSTEDIPRRWASDHEPRLSPEWFQATGVLNARMVMTPAELLYLQEQIETLIEPYLNRPEEQGNSVRLLAYFLPQA